jgi:hypothetical protein
LDLLRHSGSGSPVPTLAQPTFGSPSPLSLLLELPAKALLGAFALLEPPHEFLKTLPDTLDHLFELLCNARHCRNIAKLSIPCETLRRVTVPSARCTATSLVTPCPEVEEAVSFPDVGIPREVAEQARQTIERNFRPAKKDSRVWELAGGRWWPARSRRPGASLIITTSARAKSRRAGGSEQVPYGGDSGAARATDRARSGTTPGGDGGACPQLEERRSQEGGMSRGARQGRAQA